MAIELWLNNNQETLMNKNQLKGRVEEAKSKVKEAKGKVKEAKSEVKEAKRKVKDAKGKDDEAGDVILDDKDNRRYIRPS